MKEESAIKEFTDLIKEHQGIIFKVSGTYCNGTVCRDDLFQDILLQLWKAFPNYDKQRKFTTWMYRVALNTAISQVRKESSRRKYISGELPYTIVFDESDELKEDMEREMIVRKAINRLSKIDRSIIILYMDDYPYDEISEIIGISVSNVGVKINRIKKQLVQILKELGYGF